MLCALTTVLRSCGGKGFWNPLGIEPAVDTPKGKDARGWSATIQTNRILVFLAIVSPYRAAPVRV
jgi:hypothetical protein